MPSARVRSSFDRFTRTEETCTVRLSYIPEFAALLAAHSRLIAAEPSRFSDAVIGQQYIACRDRSNRWMQEVERSASTDAHTAESLLANRHPLVDIAERILVNDVLIRSWAAVLVLVDRSHEAGRIESMARNTHLNQMVIRHRVLSRMVSATGPTKDETSHVNTVREKVERWTDMLMSQLDADVRKDFAFNPKRADDFATTYNDDRAHGPESHVWRLVLTGIRSAFQREVPESSLVSADDRVVISTILAGLSPEVTQVTRDELGPHVGSLKL